MTTTTTYENLNDALPAGDLEVWYLRPEAFRDYGSFGENPNPAKLEATHIKLGTVAGEPKDLDDLWCKLQGEIWSPNGEANDLIRAKGLKHTSMSVGDCFRCSNGQLWRVASCGFEVIG